MPEFEMRVTGDREMAKAFERLGALGQAAALAEAAAAASEPLIRAAKGRAPSLDIADGVQLIAVEVDGRGKVTAKTGLPGGRHKWFHGLFIERGTGPRVQKTTGRRTGSMPAKPWMRPAFQAAKGLAQTAFAQHMRRRLAQVAQHGGL